MRRCPEEDNEEQKTRLDRQTAGRCRPADDGRQRAGGAADHDVLRSPSLEPCRVDNDIKKDREGKQRRRKPTYQEAEHGHGECSKHDAEGERLAGGNAPTWNWTARGSAHQSIDVCVVPHVERTRRPSTDCNAQERREANHRMDVSRRDHDAHQRGEHHERHDAGLHQRQVIRDGGNARLAGERSHPTSRKLGTLPQR